MLVAHVKKHVTTTCYSCKDCNHEFISKADFGSHLKNVHASTRCTSEVCDDKFISKEDLKEHIEKVHARKVFACEYCEQAGAVLGSTFKLRPGLILDCLPSARAGIELASWR